MHVCSVVFDVLVAHAKKGGKKRYSKKKVGNQKLESRLLTIGSASL